MNSTKAEMLAQLKPKVSVFKVPDFFHFTVVTNTATVGQTRGGGNGCSIGPVSLKS